MFSEYDNLKLSEEGKGGAKLISPETLRFFPFFAGQSHYMLQEIAMLSREIQVERGEWIFKQDTTAEKFYVVIQGAVSLALVLKLNGKGEHIEKLGNLHRGSVFGWSALVKPYEYSLGVQAEKKSKLIEIDAPPLRELLDDNPQYGYLMMKKLTEIIGERLHYKCIQLLSMKT